MLHIYIFLSKQIIPISKTYILTNQIKELINLYDL